eukprot:TRINITY_DN6287_c2_g1_i1.p1 TRINITY_DN6287_c2_g1~~TRINITY_DN6287_c2_g1_i1.p1  ORF type:complete len:970 (-),score=134.46 TRINITY_DN6287_c2_g1_i1:36-2945(-)
MKAFFEVVGTHSAESSPSLMITSGTSRYLFDLGEGLMRQSLEHQVKTRSVDKVFFTRLSAQTTADFPSYITKAHSIGKRETYFYGPVNFANYALTTRYSLNRRSHLLNITEIDSDDICIEDKDIKVLPLQVFSSLPSKLVSTTPIFEDGDRIRVKSMLDAPQDSFTPKYPELADPGWFTYDSYVDFARIRGGIIAGHHAIEDDMLDAYIRKYPWKRPLNPPPPPKPTPGCISSNAPLPTQTPSSSSSLPSTPSTTASSSKSSVPSSLSYQEGVCHIRNRQFKLRASSRRFTLNINTTSSSSSSSDHPPPHQHHNHHHDIVGRILQRTSSFVSCEHFGPNISMQYGLPAPDPTHTGTAISYICHTPDIPGKFDAKMAATLGVPEGPLRGRLAKGEDVTLPSGVTIRSRDLVSESRTGPIIIIIACPDESYLHSLIDNPRWQAYKQNPSVLCIAHLTPHDVVSSPAYQSFMCGFGPAPQHIIVNAHSSSYEPVYVASNTLLCKMNAVDPSFFPLPRTVLERSKMSSGRIDYSQFVPSSSSWPEKVVNGEYLMKYVVNPIESARIDTATCPPLFDHTKIQADFKSSPAFTPTIANTTPSDVSSGDPSTNSSSTTVPVPLIPRHTLSHSRGRGVEDLLAKLPRDHLEITFLGTGSSSASPYRNETSILLNFFKKGNILLDVGGGTLQQLRRTYGVDTDDILRHLRVIWISHMHMDHQIGTVQVLHARHLIIQEDIRQGRTVPSRDVLVIGQPSMGYFLGEYSGICGCNCGGHDFHSELDYQFLNSDLLLPPHQTHPDHVLSNPFSNTFPVEQCASFFQETFGLTKFFNINVKHSFKAKALIIHHSIGWSLAYSGDTSYCEALVDACPNPTVLIHEATFEDALQQKALFKSHCTISDALSTGRKMGAYRVILTHFSQRYPTAMVMDEEDRGHTVVAFDLMRINIQDAPVLPSVLVRMENMLAYEAADDQAVEVE